MTADDAAGEATFTVSTVATTKATTAVTAPTPTGTAWSRHLIHHLHHSLLQHAPPDPLPREIHSLQAIGEHRRRRMTRPTRASELPLGALHQALPRALHGVGLAPGPGGGGGAQAAAQARAGAAKAHPVQELGRVVGAGLGFT